MAVGEANEPFVRDGSIPQVPDDDGVVLRPGRCPSSVGRRDYLRPDPGVMPGFSC